MSSPTIRKGKVVLNYKCKNSIRFLNQIRLAVFVIVVSTFFSSSAYCGIKSSNESKKPNKKETLDYIINKMHNCADQVGLPTSVELKGNNIILSYPNGDSIVTIPLSSISKAEKYGADGSAFHIEMKEGKTCNLSANGRNGRFSIDQDGYTCSNSSNLDMDDETKRRLSNAFMHLKEIIDSEPDQFK